MVWEKHYVVDVYHTSKSVWTAVGEYMSKRLEVKASSESSAVAHWRDAAYKGNFH